MPKPCGLILLTLTVVASLTVGCQKDSTAQPDVQVDLKIEPAPPRMGLAKVTVTLQDAEGKPVQASGVKLEGNMNHAGMKPVFADAREDKPGTYKADLEFTMAGDWFILVEGKLADNRPLKKKIDVKGVRAD